jgi:tetratricopeptide (TPR) repeat protein
LLFKFAVDSHGLYGGDNIAAGKVAGHELKGLLSYFGCGLPDVYFPLMMLLDYRGFRLIAMSVLPIGSKTLIYGSNDGGVTVHADDATFNKRMRYAGRKLNLKKHRCGAKLKGSKNLWAAADIEGHLGSDGNYYLLDFSRTFPPVKPDAHVHNGHLYQLFRREFVMEYSQPLCSDAYSGFVMADPNMRELFGEIDMATDHLMTNVCPKFAKNLMYSAMEKEKNGVLHELDITEEMHRFAINLRYMGVVYKRLAQAIQASPLGEKAEAGEKLVFIEAVARVIKNMLRRKLQDKMKELRLPMEVPYRRLVVDFMNVVFGSTDASQEWWETMPAELVRNFNFDERDVPPPQELRRIVFFAAPLDSSNSAFSGRWLLFRRLRRMTGIRFSDEAKRRFRGEGRWNALEPVDILDLKEIGERVKFMSVVSLAEGTFFEIKGLLLDKKGMDHDIVEDMFARALKKYETALLSTPKDLETLLDCACAAHRLLEVRARRLGSRHRGFDSSDNALVAQAESYFRRALAVSGKDVRVLLPYARFLEAQDYLPKAEEYYLQTLEIDAAYVAGLLQYGNFLIRRERHADGNAVLAAAGAAATPRSSALEDDKKTVRVYLDDGTHRTLSVSSGVTTDELKALVIADVQKHLQKSGSCTDGQIDQVGRMLDFFGMFEVDDCADNPFVRLLGVDEKPWITVLQRPNNRSKICLRAGGSILQTMLCVSAGAMAAQQASSSSSSDGASPPALARKVSSSRIDGGVVSRLPISCLKSALLPLQGRKPFDPIESELRVQLDASPILIEIRERLSDVLSFRQSLRTVIKGSNNAKLVKPINWRAAHLYEAYLMLSLCYGAVSSDCACTQMSGGSNIAFSWEASNFRAASGLTSGDSGALSSYGGFASIDVDAPAYVLYFQKWFQKELAQLLLPLIQGGKLPKNTSKKLAKQKLCAMASRMLKVYAHIVFRHWAMVRSLLLTDYVAFAYLHLYQTAVDHKLIDPRQSSSFLSPVEGHRVHWQEHMQAHLLATSPSASF